MKSTLLILDNGSLRPEPTMALRAVAATLSKRLGREVLPVSILHSHKVEPARLDGLPAAVAKPFLHTAVDRGVRSFVCLPFFLGPSLAVTEYLPGILEELRAHTPDLRYTIAHPLAGADPQQPDPRLAEILAERTRETMAQQNLSKPAVCLVDHGTPLREINQIREQVASQLQLLLGADVGVVRGCSMERKPEPAFAFNEPLLEAIRGVEGCAAGDLVVAMFFLLSGRHAGPDGDVATICREVEAAHPGAGRLHPTRLIGEHPKLIDILVDRAVAALEEHSET